MTEEHKDIHEAINAIMKEVGYVQKQKSDTLKYTYAGEASLIEALRPSMVAHGVYMHVEEVIKIYREQYQTKSGTQMVNTLIHGVVRFEHVSGTFIDVQATGEGADSGDKSSNKAMTGMYKYALRQTFCIETGDDPDRFASEDFERLGKSEGGGKNRHSDTQSAQEEKTAQTGSSGRPEQSKPSVVEKDGYTPNEILGYKGGELVKTIVTSTGKTAVEVCKFIGSMPKDQKVRVEDVISQIKAGQEK